MFYYFESKSQGWHGKVQLTGWQGYPGWTDSIIFIEQDLHPALGCGLFIPHRLPRKMGMYNQIATCMANTLHCKAGCRHKAQAQPTALCTADQALDSMLCLSGALAADKQH
eukprot:1019475-Pelagomonas_calceolata.AAC.1